MAEITQAPAVAAKADLLRGGTGQSLFGALTFQDPNKGLKDLFGTEKFEQLKDAFDISRSTVALLKTPSKKTLPGKSLTESLRPTLQRQSSCLKQS